MDSIEAFFIASSTFRDFFDIMFSKIISIDSFAISPFSNNSNNLKISWLFNKFESNPFLSKFVIVEQRIDATNVGFVFIFLVIFSNNSIYLESKICSASCWFISYFTSISLIASSHNFGIFFSALINSLSVIIIGGISVSGYIRAAPGLGLRNFVSPTGVANLVSIGMPWFLICSILKIIWSITVWIFSSGAAKIKNASFSLIFNKFFNSSRSDFSIP